MKLNNSLLNSVGNRLAAYYSKRFGEIVYSGTLALETALYTLKVKKGDYVIIPNNVCYRVLLSVVRTGANALLVEPKNKLNLTVEDIKDVVYKYSPKVIILVHNFGLPVNIKKIKSALGDKVKILEDASLAWRLKYEGNKVGKHSDIVITSFGKTKPLNAGWGGGIFSDSDEFKKILDYNNKSSRNSTTAYLPYAVPEEINIDFQKHIRNADFNLKKTFKIISLLNNNLNIDGIEVVKLAKDDMATWHRYPIFVKSKEVFTKIVLTMKQNNIHYELPHKIKLSEIPLALRYNCIEINNLDKKEYYQINLKTNKNKLEDIRIWLTNLEKLKK